MTKEIIVTESPKIIRKVVSKQKVALRQKLSDVFDVVLYESYKNCKGAPVIIGFGDIGITPIITSNSLVDQLELPYIGSLINKDAPPAAVITGGQAMRPIRIFGNDCVIIMVSDSKLDSKNTIHLVDAIVKTLPILGSKRVFCCEGTPTETTEKIEKKEIQFVTTEESLADKLIEMNHKPLQEAVIAGITGGILAECTAQFSDHDFDICVLLAPTCSFYPDIWASVLIIQILSNIMSLTTDTSMLEKNAKKLEDKANEIMGVHSASQAMNSSLYM